MRKMNNVQTAGIGSVLAGAGKSLISPIKNIGSKILGAGSKVASKAKNSVRNLGPFSKAAGGTVAGIPAGEFVADRADLPDGSSGGTSQNTPVDDKLTNEQNGDSGLGGQPPPSQDSGSGGLLPTVSSNTAVNLGAYLAVGAVLAGGAVLAYRSISSDSVRRGGRGRNRGRERSRGRNSSTNRQSDQSKRVNSQQTQQRSQGQTQARGQQQTANATQGGVFQ